jgi:lysophospholipase L1-like esterase
MSIRQIGDSLTVGMEPYFKKKRYKTDARVGRPSSEGVEVLRKKLSERDKAIIFDMGTNDASAKDTARSMRQVKKMAHGRTLVVSTVNGPDAKAKNDFIKKFAKRNPNVVLVRGHRFADAPDGIHASPDVYRKRAEAIKRRLRQQGVAAKAPKVRHVGQSPKAAKAAKLGYVSVPTSMRELLMRGYSGR